MAKDKSRTTHIDIAKLYEEPPVADLEEHHYTEPEPIKCKWCGSTDIMKYGLRKGVQEYTCQKCGRKFIAKDAPYKKQSTGEQIGASLAMFYDGLSFPDIARQLGVSEEVINCIAGHHGEEEQQCLEAILVEAADAISGARPGARRESLESYLKRVKALEEVADSFDGVDQAYAIQAGREIRIMVKPEEIDDLAAIRLSKNIAKKVEETLEYPGQIKVIVIRETRAVEHAQ